MKKLCIFCSSRLTLEDSFVADLATRIKEKNMAMVYGGGQVGAMGQIANACLAQGVPVYGVIPEGLFDNEVAHTGLTELHTVSDMMERKRLMMELSDDYLILPGGVGTVDEAVEVITWKSLKILTGEIIFYNEGQFWQKFFDLMDDLKTKGMLYEGLTEDYKSVDNLADVFASLESPCH